MMSKNIFFKSALFLLAFCWSNYLISQCQNRTLNFDGVDDYLDIGGSVATNDFTVEGWFFATSNANNGSCNGKGQTLWWLGSPSNYIRLGECNGELFIESESGGLRQFNLATGTQIRNGWHHIAFYEKNPGGGVKDGYLFLDCQLVLNVAPVNHDYDKFVIGRNGFVPVDLTPFEGNIDEFRIWDTAKSLTDITAAKNCVLQGNEQNLSIYYKMDQGDPGNNNSSVPAIKDLGPNGFDAAFNNFSLNGNTGNLICSTSPMVYPDFTVAKLDILDYPGRQNTVSQICSGDPVHFCLTLDNLPIVPNPNLAITWEYDNGTGWTSLPVNPFNGFCFAVPPGALTIDCTTNNLGYEDWEIRAAVTVFYNNGLDSCQYFTPEEDLRICCDLAGTNLAATTNFPGDLLCDGDTVNFNVNLTAAYPFISTPAPGITIDWTYNGTALPAFANQNSFPYMDIVDAATGACFSAVVTNTNCGKSVTLNQCFQVDLIPICGTIDTLILPTKLNQISSNPKIYEICPGDDAALKIDDPFANCIPTWEYSFNLSSWTPLGSTNSIQNTNILPTSSWPGSNIYYRIKCNPLNDPSGCEPCFSDTLEIRLINQPSPVVISGPLQFCAGSAAVLTYAGGTPGLTHQWYCNGIPVGNGSSTLNATDGGCYWVESTDGCFTVKSTLYCIDACVVEARISCPNTCPKPGVPITLSACDSFDSCGLPLTYTWTVTGSTAPTINGCTITHVPDPGGTTYTVTVTNSLGCTDTTSTTIVPCLN